MIKEQALRHMGASYAAHARDLLILVERSARPIESYDLGGSRLLVGGVVVGELPGRELGAGAEPTAHGR